MNEKVKEFVQECMEEYGSFNEDLKYDLINFSRYSSSTNSFIIETPNIAERKFKYFDKSTSYLSLDLESLKVLSNPKLFDNITKGEFDKKIVGEVETRKVIFLCAQGRLVENHQLASYNLLVNDEAGTGKDYVCGAVLEILPKDCYIHKTRISPAVFTYWHNPEYEPNWTWNGKVFYPEDISEMVLNSDVFKVMTSKGSSATIIVKQKAVEIDVRGKPVMITTTATATPNPELTRRFVILNLDGSEEQTKEIMRRHSEFKKKGIVPEYDDKYSKAMRSLSRVKVKIPYADLIDKYFPSKNIIMRTHYPRFLDFISASASFHQFQRKVDSEGYLIAEGQDYDLARACFLKLCSNKYMISLTINQKKILSEFEKHPDMEISSSQFQSAHGSMSLKSMIDNMGLLVKYGLLDSCVGKDSYGRDMTLYFLSKSYNPNEKINIPNFEEMCRLSKVSITSNISIISKTSKVSPENKEDVLLTLDVLPPKHYNNSANPFSGLKLEERK